VPEQAIEQERREPTVTALLLLRSGMLATTPACGANCRIERVAAGGVLLPSRLGCRRAAAPNIEQHGEELSQADESALYHPLRAQLHTA